MNTFENIGTFKFSPKENQKDSAYMYLKILLDMQTNKKWLRCDGHVLFQSLFYFPF